MPAMFSVYQNHADLYDELVNHEDYESNLEKFLQSNVEWSNKSVCEFGVGTGRVTKLYISKIYRAVLFDNSKHMMERAKINLSAWSNRITFIEIDNRNIDSIVEQYDIVIEGWSFGHLVVEENIESDKWIDKLVKESMRIAKDKVIFIETMGTNVNHPTVPGSDLEYFYERLAKYGFKRTIIEIDYLFHEYEDAARIMGGFFGEKMRNEIEKSKIKEVKEYTGIWIYDKKKT